MCFDGRVCYSSRTWNVSLGLNAQFLSWVHFNVEELCASEARCKILLLFPGYATPESLIAHWLFSVKQINSFFSKEALGWSVQGQQLHHLLALMLRHILRGERSALRSSNSFSACLDIKS